MNGKTADGLRNLKVAVEIIAVLAIVMAGWFTLKNRTANNEKDIAENYVRIKKQELEIHEGAKGRSEIKADIREIKVEQRYIRKGIDEIKEQVK